MWATVAEWSKASLRPRTVARVPGSNPGLGAVHAMVNVYAYRPYQEKKMFIIHDTLQNHKSVT